jgi:hypothetical protein
VIPDRRYWFGLVSTKGTYGRNAEALLEAGVITEGGKMTTDTKQKCVKLRKMFLRDGDDSNVKDGALCYGCQRRMIEKAHQAS